MSAAVAPGHSPKPSTALESLFPGTLVTLFDGEQAASFNTTRSASNLDLWCSLRRGVHFALASAPQGLFLAAKPSAEQLEGAHLVWCQLADRSANAIQLLQEHDFAPSYIIDDGDAHLVPIWLLESRCNDCARIERINKDLARTFGVKEDAACKVTFAAPVPFTVGLSGKIATLLQGRGVRYRINDFAMLKFCGDTAKLKREERSDLGNARRLVRLHGHELRYFRGRRAWLIWDGCRWAADQTGEIVRRAKAAVETFWSEAEEIQDEERRKQARKWALDCQNQKRINPMIALAESEPGIPVTGTDLDADPWLLNTRSGVLDLRTGALSEPRPDLLQTKLCAAPYVAGARSELWDAVVAQLFGDDAELRAYVQRAMGYALFGAWREKAFWFGYGPPDGGKSTFLGVIGDVLGDYHVAADASTWMIQANTGGNRGDVTRLLGARLVSTLEVRASARFDQQLMKKVTGGDTLVAAAKYESDIEFAPSFSLWFGANDRPVIPDDDEGFWSRVRCVPFTRVVPKAQQDPALREKLASPEHAPAVLAWLVDGCIAWQRDGLGTCRAVQEATTSYRRDTNLAVGFFDDCLRMAPGGSVPVREVAAAYAQWARANNIRVPLSPKGLAARLRQLGAVGGDDSSRINRERRWLGVELRQAQGQERVF